MRCIGLVLGAVIAAAVIPVPSGQAVQAGLSSTFVSICSIYDSPGNIYLQSVTSSGDVYFSANFGSAWSYKGNIGTTGIVGLCSIYYSPGNIYLQAVSAGGAVYFSANFGSTWSYKGNVGAANVTGICSIVDAPCSPSHVYLEAVTGCGDVYFSDNFGSNWAYKGNVLGAASVTQGASWGHVKAIWDK